MPEDIIEYTSDAITLPRITLAVLEDVTINGINCVWTRKRGKDGNSLFSWNFDWEELKKNGVQEMTGIIIITSEKNETHSEFTVELKKPKMTVEKGFRIFDGDSVSYFLSLIPIRGSTMSEIVEVKPLDNVKMVETPVVDYEAMFPASAKSDVTLIVEEKKLHVNKSFLAFHSEYFQNLFSTEHPDEIPVNDVALSSFGLFLSVIYPQSSFPSDESAEKLLELAVRFMTPSVVLRVEHHLLNNSKIGNEKLLWLADAYGMPKLLEKCIRLIDSVKAAMKLKTSEEYQKLSHEAKSRVLDVLMDVLAEKAAC